MKNINILFVLLFTISTNCIGQVRPDLVTDFTPAERATLVDLMQQYITAEIVDWHCNHINLSGEEDIHDDFNFMPFHRVYLEGMEDFFILQGHPEFVPLPSWDPTTPTPTEFEVVDADCMATNCTINVGNGNPSEYCSTPVNWDPDESRPNYLNLPVQNGSNNDLCDHDHSPTEPGEEDEDGLSRRLEEPYHNEVHEEMGGNMFSFASPASPIFWNWHGYLDDMWKEWECNCPQSNTENVDLYIKDNAYVMLNYRDRGEEPNIDQGIMSNSPDIWVRNQQDGFTNATNEDPEYINSTTPVYVYVRVRNRGCDPSIGNETLSLHWAKGATALTWPSFWDGSTTVPELMGDLISTQNISVTKAQGSTIMEFEWIPPNPDDYNGINGDPPLFCLLARQVSTNDPMTFAEISDIEDNVRDNNNIAWKNVNVQNSSALPIELSFFSGERIRDDIQLSWQTITEIQNKGFEIYRSSINHPWEKIGWVDGNGSSTQQHLYTFEDIQPVYGINYYRLKQIDFDGSVENSEIVAVEYDKSDLKIQVFPNPSNRKFNVQIDNPFYKKMQIRINDNLGRKVWESDLIFDEPNWRKELEIDKNGLYFITVELGSETYYERIVILNN
ncbi:MAG: tyrosinase family protein [Saprospiraceae bacterium]